MGAVARMTIISGRAGAKPFGDFGWPTLGAAEALSHCRDRSDVEVRLRRIARESRAADRGDFLRRLIAAVPYKVHTVLTDNGTHFTTPGNTSSAAPDIKAAPEAGEPVSAHAFEYACAQNDVDHRLTKPKHPWTTDVIDKCFFVGSELFSSRAWVTAGRRAGREAQALPRSLHRRTSVAAPVRTRLGPRGFQPETKRA